MLGTSFILPLLAMMAGALFGMQLHGQEGMISGAAIGLGVGCAILVLIWLLFVILKKMVE